MTVKIFMCTHKTLDIIPPLCIPVQGGAKIKEPLCGTIPDFGEDGDISELNPYYCELTVQYYAWKNESCDYYGFCHYRRFFAFNEKTRAPYLTFGALGKKKEKSLLGTEEQIKAILSENDVVVPRRENIGISVYDKYVTDKYQYKEDLDRFLKILDEKYPFLTEHAERYMKSTEQYFCNMFIMKRELFTEYSSLLFSLLFEFDKEKVLHGDFQSDRTDGYLAERFLGIYLSYLKEKNIRIYETARVDINAPLKKRIINRLLPPDSKRRLWLKKVLK